MWPLLNSTSYSNKKEYLECEAERLDSWTLHNPPTLFKSITNDALNEIISQQKFKKSD